MIKTIVNEKKQTVTAIIEDCSADAINIVAKRCKFSDNVSQVARDNRLSLGLKEHGYDSFGIDAEPDAYTSKLIMPNRICAVTRVHKPDVFNEEEGIKTAKKKVVEKYNKALKKALNTYKQAIMNDLDRL